MNDIQALVGKKIQRIFMDAVYLKFETNQGDTAFTVEGDCCSHSYFYDFYGVNKLLNNGAVISAQEISLDDPNDEDSRKGDYVQAYGFELVTEDPQFGEVTSVFSFRNDSNGYYGGWMERTNDVPEDLPELVDDCLGTDHL